MIQKNKFLIAMIFLLISISFMSCKETKLNVEMVPIKVEAITIKKEILHETLTNLGTLNYKSKHSASSLVSGRLEKIFAKEGQSVKKGQVLAVLKNLQLETQKELYENNLLEAEVSLKAAEDNLRIEKLNLEKQLRSLDKLKLQIKQQNTEWNHKEQCYQKNLELFRIGGLSELKLKEEELNLLQVKTSLDVMEKEFEISSIGFRDWDIENAGFNIPSDPKEKEKLLIEINSMQTANLVKTEKSRLENARKNLMNTENLMEELKIKSSIEGIVGACNFQLGDYIAENETSFIIIDASLLDAVFYVQEHEISRYKINDPLSISVSSLNKNIDAKISEISPMADPTTGNFCLKANVENATNELKPGMFVTCSIDIVEFENTYAIPETCVIYHRDKDAGVFCISKNHAFYKNIQIKGKKNGNVYVLDDLEKNERIINKPPVYLKEGDAIEIQ